MRPLLVAILIVSAGFAGAQPPAGIVFGGGGGDCSDVARQIVSSWFDTRDFMTSDSSVKRPMASQLHCVSPAEVQTLNPHRAGASGLLCYRVQQSGVCCDGQLRACAEL